MCSPVLHCNCHHGFLPGAQTDDLETAVSHKQKDDDDGFPRCVQRPDWEGEKEASIPRRVQSRGGESLAPACPSVPAATSMCHLLQSSYPSTSLLCCASVEILPFANMLGAVRGQESTRRLCLCKTIPGVYRGLTPQPCTGTRMLGRSSSP